MCSPSAKSSSFLPATFSSFRDTEDEKERYSPIPPRSLNGGLYTGEPFWENAPWRNFPFVPSSDRIMQEQLRSAHPPPGARVLYPSGNTRPGNNRIDQKGIKVYDEERYGDMMCAPQKKKESARQDGGDDYLSVRPVPPVYSPISGRPQKFAGHAYF